MWRDTVFVAPFGMTTIYQRFGGASVAFAGKSVYHCHFLDHEDQGMIAAMMIAAPVSGKRRLAVSARETIEQPVVARNTSPEPGAYLRGHRG